MRGSSVGLIGGAGMSVPSIRTYCAADLPEIAAIWNEVVSSGNAFPQEEPLTVAEAERFFAAQSRTSVACLDGHVAGVAILHPNNVGRCGHIANASYAVSSRFRGAGHRGGLGPRLSAEWAFVRLSCFAVQCRRIDEYGGHQTV